MKFPKPCSAEESVKRALRFVGLGTYVLGGGDYSPEELADNPWTTRYGFTDSCDCWGYVSWCLMLRRHAPGFNKGPWATVSDDMNTDSCIEDSEHLKQMFEPAPRPESGDLLVFPSIRGATGMRIRIGHVGIIADVSRCLEWDQESPAHDRLEVVQCQSATRPAVKKGSGAGWLYRDTYKGAKNRAWRSRVVRPLR